MCIRDRYYGDVCDKESIRACFENLNDRQLIIIHCAGIVSIASKFNQAVYDVNVTGTKNIVDLCAEYGVAKLIYVSTVHAIPEKPDGMVITEITEFNPDDVVGLYAKTKAEATAYVLDVYKRQTTPLRTRYRLPSAAPCATLSVRRPAGALSLIHI